MKINSKMIALARDSRGITQEELANKVGISQSIMSSIENNRENPDEEIILKIASILNFPTTFFAFENSITRLSKFYYRKREAFPAKMIGPLEAKMDIMRRSYNHLLQQVKINYKGLPQLPVSKSLSPEQIAEMVRLYFNMDDGPIERPIELLERAGIPIILFDVTSDKFSGMTIHTDSNIPIIVLNKNLPNDHQKFTLFHELGHLIMHIPFTDDPDFYERLFNKDVVESEADRFAGAFIVPASKAKATFHPFNYARLTDLKLYWKISKQALIYRAKDLGVIDDKKFRNLYIEISRHGERKVENITIPIDQPSLIQKIVDVYEKHLDYTRERLATEVAGLKKDDFNNWFNLKRDELFTIVRNNLN